MDMQVGEIIKAWRTSAPDFFTKEELARRLSRSLSSIRRWEANTSEPTIADLIMMEGLKPGIVRALFKSRVKVVTNATRGRRRKEN